MGGYRAYISTFQVGQYIVFTVCVPCQPYYSDVKTAAGTVCTYIRIFCGHGDCVAALECQTLCTLLAFSAHPNHPLPSVFPLTIQSGAFLQQTSRRRSSHLTRWPNDIHLLIWGYTQSECNLATKWRDPHYATVNQVHAESGWSTYSDQHLLGR